MYKPVFQKREVLVFRQFQRKGYSLFACLGREIIISVLSVATLSATKTAGISDEVWRVDSTKKAVREVMLDDVGVTGSRAPLQQSQSARMVTVLSREDIQAASVQSVNDLLKMAVGVDVRQRGALGTQADVSIRGGTQEQIAILLNGINIGDPQTGHNVADLPVQLDEIVRVEVLEGPAGRAYGTSSLVGAINIITHPTPLLQTASEGDHQSSSGTGKALRSSATIGLEGGSFGYAKVSGRTNVQTTHWNNQVSAGYTRSDGFSRSLAGNLNTDYSGAKAFYQGQYGDDDMRLSWHAGISDRAFGASTFYASPKWQADNQYEHTTKFFTALKAETKRGRMHLTPAIYWNHFCDRYEGYRGKSEKLPYNYNRCNIYGLNLNSYVDWTLGRTAFGAELRNEDLVSTNLGEALATPVHIASTNRDYVKGLNRTNLSAHLEHNILLRQFTVSAGFIAMKSTQGEQSWQLYPSIDMSWRLSKAWKLFASYNTSLRLPSFTELYYKLQGYSADPHLKPEEMRAVEVGTEIIMPALRAKLCLYHHHGRNMIDWTMDTMSGATAHWQSVNHTRLNSYGVESDVHLTLNELLPSQKLLRTVGLSYSFMHQDKELPSNIISQYALEYLRHKLVANLHVQPLERLDVTLCYRWQDRAGTFVDFSGVERSYQPFGLLDAKVLYRLPHYQFYVEANNLTNRRNYVDYGNVDQPGFWLVAGARWTL